MKIIAGVPYINQSDRYPAGCESASAVMLLNFLHCPVSLSEFVEKDLEKKPLAVNADGMTGPDPGNAFAGDPADADSLGCYAPVILRALKKAAGDAYQVMDESGSGLEDLCRRYIDRNMPVLIWASIEMKPTVNGPWYHLADSDRDFMWISNEHCLLMIGYDEEKYYFNDPWENLGMVGYAKETVRQRYCELKKQAVAMQKKTDAVRFLGTNTGISRDGRLVFAQADTVALARKYGTPLYLLDEDHIRRQCRMFRSAVQSAFGDSAAAAFASKALSFQQIYRLMNEEGMWTDVVSGGELFTALQAGFPASRMIFHGSAKTLAEIRFGIESGVRFFAVDNHEELDRISQIGKALGKKQDVLLRITPGIEPHTFAAVRTGQIDSKFGAAIETGQAEELTAYALKKEGIRLCGFHCHIGSQIFEADPFLRAAGIMLQFIGRMQSAYGFVCEVLDLGGGMGVPYRVEDPQIRYDEMIRQIGREVHEQCRRRRLQEPQMILEPGRSIVAAAGMTLYEVQSVKEIPGYQNYAAVDGGMGDNPRYALYRSRYTVYNASKIGQPADYPCTIAGRCCESGDLIARDVRIARPQPGDILAVAVTGAYNYSMASNYNRVPRPAVVILAGGKDRLAVRRETFADLVRCDE